MQNLAFTLPLALAAASTAPSLQHDRNASICRQQGRSFFSGTSRIASPEASARIFEARRFFVVAAKPKIGKQLVKATVKTSTTQYERKMLAIESIAIPPPTLSPVKSGREDAGIEEMMKRIAAPDYDFEPVEVYELEGSFYLKSFKRCDRLEAAIRLGWPEVMAKIIPAAENKVNPKQYDWAPYEQSKAYHEAKESKRAKKKEEHDRAIAEAESRVLMAKAKKEAAKKKHRHSDDDNSGSPAAE